jgi:hypothetical protein
VFAATNSTGGLALIVAGVLILAGGMLSKLRPPHDPSVRLVALALAAFVPAIIATLWGLFIARPWSVAMALAAGLGAFGCVLVMRATYTADDPDDVDDDLGGGGGGPGGPPRGPGPDGGGLDVDWDAFEAQAHAAWESFAREGALQAA